MTAIVTKDLAKKFKDGSFCSPGELELVSHRDGGKRMVEPRDTIKIVNVVGCTNIGQEINLKQLTLALEGADYNPKEFPGLVYRTKNPKAAD